MIPKDVYVKVKGLMRFAKALASYLKDDEREDFLNEIANALATCLAYIIDKEATITIDLDKEKVTIKEGD